VAENPVLRRPSGAVWVAGGLRVSHSPMRAGMAVELMVNAVWPLGLLAWGKIMACSRKLCFGGSG
jgi:hypothetical protein